MRNSTRFVGAAAVAFAVAGFAVAADAQPYGMMGGYGPGYGMMQGYGPGYGMMRGYGYGPGPMMGGYGPGYGPGYGQNLNLSTDQVKRYLERMLAIRGNPHLKVGDVKEKDADTIVADIVTQDNSLVERFDVNRHTGIYGPEQE
jgi:hypothetical protein